MALILVVDDHETGREFMVGVLSSGGHRTLEAADGPAALELARSQPPPDLVIASVPMPAVDGQELVRVLRSEPQLRDVPVIFWAAEHLEQSARSLARRIGLEKVLTRSSLPEEVLLAVDRVLENPSTGARAAEDELAQPVVGDQLAERTRAYQLQTEKLEALIDIGLYFGTERNLERLLEDFFQAARRLVGARHAMVGIVENGELCYLLTTHEGFSPDPQSPLMQRLMRETVRHAGDPGLTGSHPPVRSFLGTPVVSPSHAYGWLCLVDRLGADHFSLEDERVARVLAAQLGRTYENGALYREVEQKKTELQRLFESTPEALMILDSEGVLLDLNPTACGLLGLSSEQLLGRRFRDFAAPGVDAAAILSILREKRRYDGECTLMRPDGTVRELEIHAVPNFIPGRHLVGFHDVTERKSLQQQLLHAQKMEAVGRLAGGVAHDFNNLLTVIGGYSDLLLASMPAQDQARQAIEEIAKAAERAADLTRQLLAFGRRQMLSPIVLDLNSLVADARRMLQRLIGADVELETRLAPSLSPVRVDPGQMMQVLVNLAVNARDAMPQGGRLILESSEQTVSGSTEVPDGNYAILTVTDTGVGMDGAVRSQVFEPFFTTKSPDQGTGLGLSTVYGIVKQSDGHIEVSSAPGQGTTFQIYLPASSEPPSPPFPTGAGAMPRGSETILLVEDEDAVRTFLRASLGRCGYRVVEAANGEEALVLAAELGSRLDLLVSDVVLPRLGGPDLARRLRADRPDLRVLLTSGYSRGSDLATFPFLRKPFTAEVLANRVREVLDS
ncbi:MAG: response regulator [Armatimonadetes bacterium]|nr:response regulator [Armatimonadota bacterium]